MTVQHYKVLFTGPVGAGKTTAIRSISDGLPMMIDVRATDETRDRKPQTTVAMDYGVIRLGRSEVVHLYGTPGQERFDFMWEILQEGALGLVLLVDNDTFIRTTGVVVGITRTDVRALPARQEYLDLLLARDLRCPTFTVDARSPADVSLLVRSLLYCLDPQVQAS